MEGQATDRAMAWEGNALAQAVLNVLPVGNDKHPDEKVVAFYLTAGELRAIRGLATDEDRVNKGPAADAMAEALAELIAACDGEISEVFAFELGSELDAAVKALATYRGQQ